MKNNSEKVALTASDSVPVVGTLYGVKEPAGWLLLTHMMPATKESWQNFVPEGTAKVIEDEKIKGVERLLNLHNRHLRFAVTADIILQNTDKRFVFIRRRNEPYKGMLALPGGYVEPGKETTLQAAIREAREEIGVDISLFVKPEAVARDDTQEREKPIGNNSIETKQDNLATPKLDNSFNLSYLIVGDSFMAVGGGLGDVVEKTVLNYGNTTVNRYGMVSSGLSRPDYFDWNSQAEKLVSKYKPDIVIAMFGANDNQNLTDKSGNFVAKYGEQSWVDEYSNRVSDMLSIFEENKIIVFWVGLPVMREKWFSEKVAKLDSIYDDECQKRQNAYFVSTWRTLADSDGKYSAYLKNGQGRNELARIRDGIHLTYFGGALVTQEISKKISEVLDKKLSLLSFK